MTRHLLLAAKHAGFDFLYIPADNIISVRGSVACKTQQLTKEQFMDLLLRGQKDLKQHQCIAVCMASTSLGHFGNREGSVRSEGRGIRSRDFQMVLTPTQDSRGLIYGAFVGYSTRALLTPPYDKFQATCDTRDDMEFTVNNIMRNLPYIKHRSVHVVKNLLEGGQNQHFASARERKRSRGATDHRILNAAVKRAKT